MSSLAAARADGYYYATDYDPKKHKSLNKYRNSHPLGKRAKELNDGTLIIRFEIPFKVWCLGCNQLIDKGVRFDARKKCVGHYFTTKIWQFTMNCYNCSNEFSISTDPKSTEYICTKGVRAKLEPSSITAFENVATQDHDKFNNQKWPKISDKEMLTEMYKLQSSRYSDDFLTNSTLRINSKIRKKIDPKTKSENWKRRFDITENELLNLEGEFRKQNAKVKSKKNRKIVMRSSIFKVNLL